MLSNYIRIAWRNIRANPFYSLINIFGLSLGIACGLILFQFISFHQSFDRYHRKEARIYRVVYDLHLEDGRVETEGNGPIGIASVLKQDIPQVERTAVLFRKKKLTVAIPAANGSDKLFNEQGNIAFADNQWFELFDQNWKKGDPATALSNPNSVVITRRTAGKYFGGADPVGRTIKLDNEFQATVTGVVADYPDNTDSKVDLFLSLSSLKNFNPQTYQGLMTDWSYINSTSFVYVLLKEGASVSKVRAAIPGLTQSHMGDLSKYFHFNLQSLEDVHFDPRYGGVIQRSLLTALALTGLFLVLIACINFINMATAQSSKRAKEIGTRKLLGSSPRSIFLQFMIEAATIVLAAAILSACWILLVLPVLNEWLEVRLEFDIVHNHLLFAYFALLLVLVTAIGGFYPAIVLSRFKPVEALKNQATSFKTSWQRKGLIVLQNVIAQVLIISTLIIALQVRYMRSADLGFNKDAVLMVPVPKSSLGQSAYLRQQLLAVPGITDLSYCFQSPSSGANMGGSVRIDDRPWEKFVARSILGDARYISTFGLKLIAGQNLRESDTIREFLIDQQFMYKLGYNDPSKIIGHTLFAGNFQDRQGIIVGVVRDFHYHSLYAANEPVLITTNKESYEQIAIKLNSHQTAATLPSIQKIWQTVCPGYVFEYHYLDQQIANFYHREEILTQLIRGAAIIAILISCLGLLGLISLMTVRRTKEIGIRKIVGASVSSITYLLTGDFMRLILLAIIISAPIALLIMRSYLQHFAYRIPIYWWIFPLSALAGIIVSFSAISFHTIRAAMSNPVESLRSE